MLGNATGPVFDSTVKLKVWDLLEFSISWKKRSFIIHQCNSNVRKTAISNHFIADMLACHGRKSTTDNTKNNSVPFRSLALRVFMLDSQPWFTRTHDKSHLSQKVKMSAVKVC